MAVKLVAAKPQCKKPQCNLFASRLDNPRFIGYVVVSASMGIKRWLGSLTPFSHNRASQPFNVPIVLASSRSQLLFSRGQPSESSMIRIIRRDESFFVMENRRGFRPRIVSEVTDDDADSLQ